MNLRNYEKTDYALVSSWFQDQQSFSLPEYLIPPTGLIIEDKIPLCAGWLYKTDGGVALIENFIGNPDAPKEQRKEAVNLLLNSLVTKAKDDGFKIILSMSKHPRLIEYGKNIGFIELQNFKVMMRGL